MIGKPNQGRLRERNRLSAGSRTIVVASLLLSTTILAAAILAAPASAGPGWDGPSDDKDGVCAKGSAISWPVGEKPDRNGNGIVCINLVLG